MARVILSDADVARLAEASEGDLEQTSFAALAYAYARTSRSLTLDVNRPPSHKEITFENGVPVQCTSNLVHETLSRFMTRSGRLPERIASQCFAESCSRGLRFGDVLLEKGVVSAEDLRKALQENLVRRLLDVFSWHHGTFHVKSVPAQVDTALHVNVPQLIVLGVTRFATQAQVDASIGPLIGTPLGLNTDPFFEPAEIRLNPIQQQIVERLEERPLRIDELAEATDIEFRDLTRLLYALTLIAAVVPVDPQQAMTASRHARPRTETTPTPAAAPSPESEAEAEAPSETLQERRSADPRRDDLMRLVLNYRRKDPFELLALDPRRADTALEDHFVRFAQRFAPWTHDDDLQDEAREVFLAGARAYAELADPDRRTELVEGRGVSPQAVGRARSEADFRVHTTLLDPDIQFTKGRTLMAAGRFKEAVDQFAYASNLDPQNLDYRCELAYCRYLADPSDRGRAALEHLERTLRLDPRHGLSLFYRGEILRRSGRYAEAQEAYQKAIKPMAPDRRPIDALRAMQREHRPADEEAEPVR